MTIAVIDTKDLAVNAVFKIIEVEDVHASEREGYKVTKQIEVAEIHKAGDKHNIPVMQSNDFYRKDGVNVITVAEHFSEQYRQFKAGETQEALGTPISSLSRFGLTPSDLSLCRANRIYSVESVLEITQSAVKGLGMRANDIQEAARQWAKKNGDNGALIGEIEALKAQIAAMQGNLTPAVQADFDADEDPNEALSVEELRAKIEAETGSKPDGRLSREKLLMLAKGL